MKKKLMTLIDDYYYMTAMVFAVAFAALMTPVAFVVVKKIINVFYNDITAIFGYML